MYREGGSTPPIDAQSLDSLQPVDHLSTSFAHGRVRVREDHHRFTVISIGRKNFFEVSNYDGFEFNKEGEINRVLLREHGSAMRKQVLCFADKPGGKGYEYDVFSAGVLGEEGAQLIGSAYGIGLNYAIANAIHPDPELQKLAGDYRIDESVITYLMQVIEMEQQRDS